MPRELHSWIIYVRARESDPWELFCKGQRLQLTAAAARTEARTLLTRCWEYEIE